MFDEHKFIDMLVRQIRVRLAFGWTRDQIRHDFFQHDDVTEDLFFLAWNAAQMLDEDDVR